MKLSKRLPKKGVYSGVLNVEHGNNGFTYIGAIEKMEIYDRYFIASVTKLYSTLIILKLIRKGSLKIENPISVYLGENFVKGLNVYKGVEYSNRITVKHLISNTSPLEFLIIFSIK